MPLQEKEFYEVEASLSACLQDPTLASESSYMIEACLCMFELLESTLDDLHDKRPQLNVCASILMQAKGESDKIIATALPNGTSGKFRLPIVESIARIYLESGRVEMRLAAERERHMERVRWRERQT